MLLPGEELDFPFYFKSPNPGIFNEMWVLGTSPVLNRGRPLLVILKGVAFQHDLYEERRDQIEVCDNFTFCTGECSYLMGAIVSDCSVLLLV